MMAAKAGHVSSTQEAETISSSSAGSTGPPCPVDITRGFEASISPARKQKWV